METFEHLEWSKQRALEFIELDQPGQAHASMVSDLCKHDHWLHHPGLKTYAEGGMILVIRNDRTALRRWIEEAFR